MGLAPSPSLHNSSLVLFLGYVLLSRCDDLLNKLRLEGMATPSPQHLNVDWTLKWHICGFEVLDK